MNTYAKVGGEGGWKIWKTISYSLPSKETEVQCMTSSNEKKSCMHGASKKNSYKSFTVHPYE